VTNCARAIEKVREGMKKPYYRQPINWADYEVYGKNWETSVRRNGELTRLAMLLVAHAIQTQRLQGDDVSSATDLIDAVRLGVFTSAYDDLPGHRALFESLSHVAEWAKSAKSSQALRTVMNELRAMEKALGPPTSALEYRWRILDNTARIDTGGAPAPIRFGANTMLSWKLAAASRIINRNKDELRAAVAMEYRDCMKWIASHPELREQHIGDGVFAVEPLADVEQLVRGHTSLHNLYRGAFLAVAVECYRAEKNTYPETLDALVPAYADALPGDFYSGAPFVYRRENADYLLYNLGRNGKDENGIPRGSDDEVVHAPPDSEN